MEFTSTSSSLSLSLPSSDCNNRSLNMKTRRQKKKQILIVWTTVIAMLMMMIMINNMPIANSLASSASNSLMQRRSLTSLSSLSYYATIIGSATNIGGDEIEIPRPPSTRMQQRHNSSSYPLVEVLGVVSDETEDGDDPTMIYNSATATSTSTSTSNNILINTWNKIKSSMKFDKQAIIGLGFDFGLTYNFISNINGSITLSVAWYIASMKVSKENNTMVYFVNIHLLLINE